MKYPASRFFSLRLQDNLFKITWKCKLGTTAKTRMIRKGCDMPAISPSFSDVRLSVFLFILCVFPFQLLDIIFSHAFSVALSNVLLFLLQKLIYFLK